MTLLDILKSSEDQDLSNTEVWVENNPTYDQKGGADSIYIISQPFGDSNEIETLTVQEIINFSEELEVSEENLKFICEYESQELNSFQWLENKLILSF